jgi:hypothetical protein
MCIKLVFLLLISVSSFFDARAIKIDSTASPGFFKGQIQLTHNGVSLIPNFSLGKPAVMADLSMGKGRFSFDPMMRFNINTKPWAFVLWTRYKLIHKPKFSLGLGAHPAYLFRTEAVQINGKSKEVLDTQRYLAWEATPTYHVSKKLALGIYYLGSHGLRPDLNQWLTFLTARAIISNLSLGPKFSASFLPQYYYLKQDFYSGTYVNCTFNIYKKKFPISITGMLSQGIHTTIPGKKFLWSTGLVYNINRYYKPVIL